MKKTFLVIVGLLAMTGMYVPANAQDTLQIRWPLAKYFKYQWPRYYYGEFDTFRVELGFYGSYQPTTDIAYYMFSEDSLTIYGVAACLISEKDLYYGTGHFFPNYDDTTYKDVYDYLCVYEAGDSDITPIREVKAHMHVTPIAYYMDMNAYQQYNGSFMQPILPMYECYFTQPVTVIDSFYIGRHLHAHRFSPYNGWYGATTMQIYHATTSAYWYGEILIQPFVIKNMYFNEDGDTITQIFYANDKVYSNPEQLASIPLMFPILEPGPAYIGSDTTATGDTLIVCDTTIIGGDTIVTYDTILSIGQNDMLQRFTSVIPNPAAKTAKVVSSPGMNRVEVFNMAGRRVYDKTVEGLSVSLDVSRWPAGTYLVRIHTPLGVSTKKLAVSR